MNIQCNKFCHLIEECKYKTQNNLNKEKRICQSLITYKIYRLEPHFVPFCTKYFIRDYVRDTLLIMQLNAYNLNVACHAKLFIKNKERSVVYHLVAPYYL